MFRREARRVLKLMKYEFRKMRTILLILIMNTLTQSVLNIHLWRFGRISFIGWHFLGLALYELIIFTIEASVYLILSKRNQMTIRIDCPISYAFIANLFSFLAGTLLLNQ